MPILSTEERQQALALPRGLQAARQEILEGKPVAAALFGAEEALLIAGFSRVDYFALVDAATLEPLEEPAGDDAADRRGRDREDTLDRQFGGRIGHSLRQGERGVNHLFVLNG